MPQNDPLGILAPKNNLQQSSGDPLGILSSQQQQPTFSGFQNAQRPTGQISNQQVLGAQQHLNTFPQQTNEQKQVANYGEKFVHAQQDEKIKNAAINTVKKQNISNADEADKKVQDLLKASDNGDVAVTQDAQGNDILKPTGNFIQSYKAAYANAFQQNAQDAYLSSLPKDKAIEYLNQKQQHPELFTQEQDVAPSGISKMLGEQTDLLTKGIIGGIGGSALAPETGGASMGTFLAMTKDLASSGYSQALQKTYYRLKELHPEMSDDQIFDNAKQAALTGEAVSLGTGALLSAEMPKPTIPVNGVMKAFEHTLKSSPKVVGSAAVGSVINDLKENDVTGGQGVNWDAIQKNAAQAAQPMAIMHFGLGALSSIVNGAKSIVPSYTRPQIENVVASAPREQVAQFYQNAEENGTVPQGTTQKVLGTLSAFDKQKAIVAPFAISEENKAAIAGKLVQKQKLLDELQTLKPNENAFPERIAEINKNITGIDGEINKLYNAKDVFQKETDTNTGERTFEPKTFEELKPQERNGIEVPKEYGDTEVKQSGEGDNKTFTAKAFYREPQGSLVIRRNIPIEENSFTDKDKAQQAADNALKQHYYENGLHDNAKPDKKIKTETQAEKPIEEGNAGSNANNEPIITEETKPEPTNVTETTQEPTKENVEPNIISPINENEGFNEKTIEAKKQLETKYGIIKNGNEWKIKGAKSDTIFNVDDDELHNELDENKKVILQLQKQIENANKDWNKRIVPKYGNKEYNRLSKDAYEASQNKTALNKSMDKALLYDEYLNERIDNLKQPQEKQIISPINTEQNAVQEQSTGSLLQHPQETVGETGGERTGMESGKQGNETTTAQPKEVNPKEEVNQGGEPPKEGEPPLAETPENETTSIKNATTKLRREQYGLDEEIPAAKKEFGTTWEEAKDKIENGYNPQDLVDELAAKPRPITDVENAILLHNQNTKEINLIDLNKQINEAAEKGNVQNLQEAKTAKARVLDELQKIYDVNKAVGTEQGRGLAARKMMVDRRYSLANMVAEKRATANDGKPLSDEQQAEVEALHKKINETEKAFDDYVKHAESEIKGLQEKILGKKVGNKKSAAQKLRDLADKIEKSTAGQTYASIVPITPKMIAGAMRLIADGLEKGEDILNLIKDAVEKIKGQNKDIDEAKLTKAINKEVIDSGIISATEKERKSNKDLSGLVLNNALDRKALALKADADRAKNEFDISVKKDAAKKESILNKVQNTFIKWQRGLKLSNPLTMGKLVSAGLTRLISTPLEDIAGALHSTILPRLAKGAIGEGGGLNVKETANAYKTGLIEGMKDAATIMKKGSQGKSDIDVAFGKLGELPPEAIDFFGQLHSATKAPIKRFAFERSLSKRLRRNVANGVDVSDPMVQTEILTGAYKDANRAIFMQDNKVATGFQNLVKYFESKDKATGKPVNKPVATALQWMLPFVKIPTNIAAEIGSHVYGLPLEIGKGIVRMFDKNQKGLTEDENDIIFRNLKKGTLGTAAMALGYFNPQNFGGFYQKGQKKQQDDAQALGLKLFGKRIPAWFIEAPIFQTMQLGATIRRIKDERVKGEEKGIGEGVWAGALGLVDKVPMVDQPMRMAELFSNAKDRQYYLGELAKSTVDPALVTYLANVTDPADRKTIMGKILNPENKRTNTSIVEHIKSGIPGLRETLPIKETTFTEENRKEPTFKYFLDKGLELPNTSMKYEEITNEEKGTKKTVADYPQNIQDKYKAEHTKQLKQILAPIVSGREKVYVKTYKKANGETTTSVSIDEPNGNYKSENINKLSKEQLAQLLHLAQSNATTATKEKIFNK